MNREFEAYKKLLIASGTRKGTDSQLVTLLSTFRADITKEKVLQQEALEAFSKQLQLEAHPRLGILLMRMGITTDDRAVVVQGAPLSAALKPMQSFLEVLSQ
ncbi:MAG: hypothetical protein EOP10_28245 [Proteobacteria bacterium]|nr:MAG: hypothetical protein EOP10_28245 [Pseudomonadota bacterium]